MPEVHAVFTASGGNGPMSHSRLVIQAVEKAMSDAVLACSAEGISVSDPKNQPIINQRMMEARRRVLNSVSLLRK